MFPPPPRPPEPDEAPDDRPLSPEPPAVDRALRDGATAEDFPLSEAPSRVARLEARVRVLERKLAASNLHNESFLTRAFTVWGHFMVAYLFIIIPFTVMILICAGVLGTPSGGGLGTGKGLPR
ncbi:MAG: hypothetical protein U0804_07285 [Gemmataceae bacterium]